jgi:hypothetical protein
VFGAIFFTITTSFIVFIVIQSKLVAQKVEVESAGQIAEAGLNYYKWYLSHYPNDTTNGTGLPGPYIGVYKDPEGSALGEYSLSVASTTYCGDVASIDVSSVGHTYKAPTVLRTQTARYARPTVASFAVILNSNVWAGSDRIINGPYHSNGGVRMDGTNNSVVTSGQSTWACDPSFGCSPTSTKNGVFTTTANADTSLFDFPAAPINFAGITVDLASMQTRAQTKGGLYIPPSGAYGYQLVFNSSGTVSVYKVTNTSLYWGFTTENGWVQERNVISATTSVATYAIPASCPLIFVEDKVWLSGIIKNRVALAAADLDSPGVNPSIVLQGNITYTSATSSGFMAVGEQDILIGVNVPTDMVINGVYVAQNGRYGRNHYDNSSHPLPGSLTPYILRNSETMNGTIVSNGRVGTQWTSGGVIVSGFQTRTNTYDRNLIASPPPLIPVTSDVYQFSEWRDGS